MKKIIKLSFAVAAVLCVALVSACAFKDKNRREIERRWNVSLPQVETVYHKDNWGWFGDGNAYTLFNCKNFSDNEFKLLCASYFGDGKISGWSEKSDYVTSTALQGAVYSLIGSLNVPPQYTPDFGDNYLFSYNDNLYDYGIVGIQLIYFNSQRILIICEGRI